MTKMHVMLTSTNINGSEINDFKIHFFVDELDVKFYQ